MVTILKIIKKSSYLNFFYGHRRSKKGKSISENQKWTKINVQNRFSENNLGKNTKSSFNIINLQKYLKNRIYIVRYYHISENLLHIILHITIYGIACFCLFFISIYFHEGLCSDDCFVLFFFSNDIWCYKINNPIHCWFFACFYFQTFLIARPLETIIL